MILHLALSYNYLWYLDLCGIKKNGLKGLFCLLWPAKLVLKHLFYTREVYVLRKEIFLSSFSELIDSRCINFY